MEYENIEFGYESMKCGSFDVHGKISLLHYSLLCTVQKPLPVNAPFPTFLPPEFYNVSLNPLLQGTIIREERVKGTFIYT